MRELLKTPPNQRAILGVLLVVWGFIYFQTMGMPSEPPRVPLKNVTGSASIQSMKRGEPLSGTQRNLKEMSQKNRRNEVNFTSPKNIFDLYRSEGNQINFVEQPPSGEGEQASFEGEAVEQDKENNYGRFRFLGYVYLDHSTQDEQGIALVSTPDALHAVRVGETIEGYALIKEVSPDGVTIENLSSHQEQRLALSGRGD